MSDLLNIGSSAVTAYRSALAAVGENVANAQTPGYARRSVVLRQAATSGGPDLIHRESAMFNGVTAAGVARAWDSFLAAEARHSAGAYGRADARQTWLTGIESALADGPSGVGASLTGFFNAGARLAADPADPLLRGALLTSLEDVAAAFRTTGAALGRIADGVRASAAIEADAANRALAALHDLNGALRAAPPGGSARAALEDERDRLIDALADRIGLTAHIAADGTARIEVAGASGTFLLDGQGPGHVHVAAAADGRLALQLGKNGTTVPLPATAGRLAGLVEAAGAAAERRSALDALARDTAASFNAWSAAGCDAGGAPGADLLAASGAADMRVLATDPAAVPAATADGRGNGNLLDLAALRGPGGAEARWGTIVSGNAQALASARAEAIAASAWRDHSAAALDEVTGVDLDREAAELLRFQQAYNGSARVIQVARETLNAILDLF
jgi:flagellar hook-associated protein 1